MKVIVGGIISRILNWFKKTHAGVSYIYFEWPGPRDGDWVSFCHYPRIPYCPVTCGDRAIAFDEPKDPFAPLCVPLPVLCAVNWTKTAEGAVKNCGVLGAFGGVCHHVPGVGKCWEIQVK